MVLLNAERYSENKQFARDALVNFTTF